MTDENKTALLSKLRAPVADERAAFEAQAVTEFTHPFKCPDPTVLDPDGSGNYADPDVQLAWIGFKWGRAALASAPVAGEVVAHAVLAYGRIQRVVVNEESAHEYAEQQRLNAEAAGWDAKAHTRPLVYGDAAPQASEAVPNEPLRVFSAGMWTYDGTGQAFSHTELDEAAFVTYRAALSAQPGAQRTGGSDGTR